MVSTQVIANTILWLSFKQDIPVSPMKLQKLMYFVYKDYLQTAKKPLFSERFECWQYGPVLTSIYYEFNRYRAKPITKFARDAEGNVSIVDLDNQTKIAKSIKKIWNKYKHFDGTYLSRLTHKSGGAWEKAYNSNCLTLSDEDIKNEPE